MNIGRWPVSGERERELIDEVLRGGQWGGFSEMVGRFEREFAAYQGARHGIAVFNGTVSLEMMLEVAGIGPGDEVIVPAISFVSTATAVTRVGAVPVFVDIEGDTFNLDPERVREAVGKRTRAVIVVHFGGVMTDVEKFGGPGWVVFEDAAHGHGSEWNGRRAGTFGLAGSFSFQNGKVMTSGEGGMVVTDDDGFAEKCRGFANQGRRAGAGFFHHFTVGTNFRMTGLQAAVLVAQLEKLDGEIARRAQSERAIREGTEGLVRWQRVPSEVTRRSHYLLLGRVERRDELCKGLAEARVPCTPFYPHPLYGNPLYREGGCRVESCPVAEACVRDAFWLPHRVLMSDPGTVREIVDVMRRILR